MVAIGDPRRAIEGLAADLFLYGCKGEGSALTVRQRQIDARSQLEPGQGAAGPDLSIEAGFYLDIEAEERPAAGEIVLLANQLDRHAHDRPRNIGARRRIAAERVDARAHLDLRLGRSEESRVGTGCVRKGRYRGSPYH